MNLEFSNCPQPAPFDASLLPSEKPAFLSYEPDVVAMQVLAAEFGQYKNILVIGHGGSITSSYAFYHALKHEAAKKAYFLNTVDPDYIAELRKELAVQDTLVIAISKSGETVTQLEALSQFLDYQLLFITEKGSTLNHIAQKVGARVVEHPPIGGRYTAFTEVSLLPAFLCGLDVQGLLRGARELFAQYEKENLAWKAASILWQLELQGYTNVFMPIYSHYLYPTQGLVVQLCHESFGKAGKGQVFVASDAPESQHHTNQRFFGGAKNMCGFFIDVEHFASDAAAQYPPVVHSVAIKGHPLFDINKIPLANAMHAELHGTLDEARLYAIPFIHMNVTSVTSVELGRFIAFWQLFAVYGSLLRKVNPFDQPEVEHAKKVSFEERLKYKGL